jgi:hypothetical protein
MYDLDAIEAINIDQLVTPLDRILLAHRHPRRRPSRPTMNLDVAAEKTVYVRASRSSSLVAPLAVAACATWLSVAVACLLA